MFGKNRALEETNAHLHRENASLKDEIARLKQEIERLSEKEADVQRTFNENRLKTELTNSMLSGCKKGISEIQKDIEYNLEASKEIAQISEATVSSSIRFLMNWLIPSHALPNLRVSHANWLKIYITVWMKFRA